MTTTGEKYKPMFPTTEGDLWRRQRETLDDLAAFIDAHAPGTAAPLPVLHWHITTTGTVAAELYRHETDPSGIRADPRAVIAAYAAALGTEVIERRFEQSAKTRYTTRGRIGPPVGTAKQPRTAVAVTADVWDPDDDQE